MFTLPPDYARRVSRRDLAANRLVSLTYGGVFAILTVVVAALPLFSDRFPASHMLPLAAAEALAAVWGLFFRPPPIASVRNHLTVLSVPVIAALGMVAFAPAGAAAVAGAMFAGIHTAARIHSRRALLAHTIAASAILLLPLLFLGFDRETLLALISGIPATIVVGACTMLVLTAAEEQGDELERLVRRDPLTGVGNPQLLQETLAGEIARHRATRGTFALLTIDIDGLRAFNARFGTSHGDALLQRVATLLESLTGERDTVARHGDDEFSIVLPGAARDQAERLAASIREEMRSLPTPGNPLTVSTGVAVFPSDARTPELVLDVADTRLALGKHATRTSWSTPSLWSPEPLPATAAAPADPEPRIDVTAGFTRLRRSDVALNRAVWLATGGMVAFYAVIFAIGLFAFGERSPSPGAIAAAGAYVAASVLLLSSEPPAAGSPFNHAVIAVPYLAPALIVFVAPDFAALALGPMNFVGALTAVRLERRRHIALHFAAATIAIDAVIAFGGVSAPMVLAMLILMMITWTLGVWIAWNLEGAESEADELERLVRRDPVSGLGNRRLLLERLDDELPRHARRHRSITLVTLELLPEGDETSEDSPSDGSLAAVGALLRSAAPAGATVVRDARRTCAILLPSTTPAQAAPIVNALRVRLDGHAPSVAIAAASYPEDATEADVLRRVAAWRRGDASRPGLAGAGAETTVEIAADVDPFTIIDGGKDRRLA